VIIAAGADRRPREITGATGTRSEFHPGGVYRINIDDNGDAQADAAFTFTFSEFRDGRQTCTAHYANGSQAREPEPAGYPNGRAITDDAFSAALPG
jgi:hypothetical protein